MLTCLIEQQPSDTWMFTLGVDSDADMLPVSMNISPTPQRTSSAVNQESEQARSVLPSPPAQEQTRIVILHGDPTKPNDILPGGRWDEDDFYTIQVAKEALKKLEHRFHFTWLCNHDTLMDDLRRLKRDNQVDLVLQVCCRCFVFILVFMMTSCVMRVG